MKAKKRKVCDDCGCDDGQQMGPGSLMDRIWESQLSKKELWINGPIDDRLMYTIVAQIQNINEHDDECEATMVGYERDPILLFLHSPGGDPAPAWAVISAIKASRTPVITIAMGRACSAAFLILLAGDFRYAQEYSELMYHQAYCWYGGPEKTLDVQERAEEMQRLNEKAEKYVLENTRLTEEQLAEVYFGKRDWYIDIDYAIKHRVIDSVWGRPDLYADLKFCPGDDTVCSECEECAYPESGVEEAHVCGCTCEECLCEELLEDGYLGDCEVCNKCE